MLLFQSTQSKRWILWALCAALWFSSLGIRELLHPDEGRYSEISREMAISGDFVTPRLNGLKYFEKPPLQYWITAGAFAAFGQSEFVARLWVGLCGFLSLLLVWFTARKIWDAESADYAAVCAAGMFWLIGLSHVVTLDMGVSFFLFSTLCSFMLAQQDNATAAERRGWMWATWASIAGALLSKGLIGLIIPGAVLLLYTLLTRQWVIWKRAQWIPGLLILVLLGLPWHLLVAQRNPEWANFYLIHEHFTRFTTTEHHRAGPWYYFVPVLIGGLLPWTSLLPKTISASLRTTGGFNPEKLLLIWIAFIFVFFSLSGSKLPGYILPIFPAIALLMGPCLKHLSVESLRPHVIGLTVLWIIVALGSFALPHLGNAHMPAELHAIFAHWLLAGAGLFAAACLVALQFLKQARKKLAMLTLSLASLLFTDVVAVGYQRSYTQNNSARDIAAVIAPRLQADTQLFFVGMYNQAVPFYLKRTMTLVDHVDEFELGETQEPSAWLPTLAQFETRWRAAPSAIAIVSPSIYTELQNQNLPMNALDQNSRSVTIEKPQH